MRLIVVMTILSGKTLKLIVVLTILSGKSMRLMYSFERIKWYNHKVVD